MKSARWDYRRFHETFPKRAYKDSTQRRLYGVVDMGPPCSSHEHKDMTILNLYRCNGGTHLLYDGCMQAPIHDQHRYGPLQFVTAIDSNALPPDLRPVVERQLSNRLFAILPADALPSEMISQRYQLDGHQVPLSEVELRR